MDADNVFSIQIKKEYYSEDLEKLKRELNYLSNFLHENLMTLELKTVEEYERIIKIMSEVLLERIKEKILPHEKDETVTLQYNPLQLGKETRKMLSFMSKSNNKNADITLLLKGWGTLTFNYLNTFTLHCLYRFSQMKELHNCSALRKKELIYELLRKQPIDTSIEVVEEKSDS